MPNTVQICTSQVNSSGIYIGPPSLPFGSDSDIVICPQLTHIEFNGNVTLGTGRTLEFTYPTVVIVDGDLTVSHIIVHKSGHADQEAFNVSLHDVIDLYSELTLTDVSGGNGGTG